jgi:hypothetical protein
MIQVSDSSIIPEVAEAVEEWMKTTYVDVMKNVYDLDPETQQPMGDRVIEEEEEEDDSEWEEDYEYEPESGDDEISSTPF